MIKIYQNKKKGKDYKGEKDVFFFSFIKGISVKSPDVN